MLDFDLWTLGYMGGVIFVGAVVRGFSGFGSSLVWVSGLTLVMAPVQTVPIILILEVAASLVLLPGIWRDVDWATLRPLFAGAICAAPLGVGFLAVAPAAIMQVLISSTVLVAAIALWWNRGFRHNLSRRAVIGVGATSGLLAGATSAGGPPVILFYLASPSGAAISRASLIIYFLGTYSFAAVVSGTAGLITKETLIAILLSLPVVACGAQIGKRRFLRTHPDRFRHATLVILTALASANLVRTAL